MSEIRTLSPSLLWKWFDTICTIPHPSYQEEALANYLVNWAKTQGFFVERDEVGNVLIRKPATAGMEMRPTIALQAHLDMVAQANSDTTHDFSTDPIQPYIDGEWVKARGTTLGADNGIGLASCLAVLESTDLAHPEVEVLLTMTEEVGMEGAMGLRPNWLKANRMINTDTEDNGEIYIGCAGGENINLNLPVTFEKSPDSIALKITLSGLRGGHSGCDIHTNRVNAIKLFAQLLADACRIEPFQLAKLLGGSARNAIPREVQAVVFVSNNAKNRENFTACLTQLCNDVKGQLSLAEPNLTLDIELVECSEKALSLTDTQKALDFLNVLPNGIVRYSDAVKNVVESSLSLGILNLSEQGLDATILARSLIETGKAQIRSQLQSLATLTGAEMECSGDYPGWEPDPHSQITALTKKIYDEILGEEAKIKVIHAGLECGLIKKVYPTMDVVSIGPTIRNAHSPDEKVHIPAVEIYWELLTQLLAKVGQ